MQENKDNNFKSRRFSRERNLCDIYADYESIYCDIKVLNTMYGQEVFHRRVPKLHVDWMSIAPHLKVKILKKYKVDNGYYKRNFSKKYEKSNKNNRGG